MICLAKVTSITDEIISMYCKFTLSDELDAIDRSFEDGTADPYQLKRILVEILLTSTMVRKALRLRRLLMLSSRTMRFLTSRVSFPLKLMKMASSTYQVRVEVEIASSNGETRRLIDGGGIQINQQPHPARVSYK